MAETTGDTATDSPDETPSVEELIAPVRSNVSSPDEPFSIFIEITLKPGVEDEFEREFASAVEATRREPENIDFQLHKHPTERNVYLHYERWENLGAVEEHMSTPHMTEFWPKYLPMLARTPEFEIYMIEDL